MIVRALLLLGLAASAAAAAAFAPRSPAGSYSSSANAAFSSSSSSSPPSSSKLDMAAESEVSFGDLDGADVRVGIIRTRWNDEHVTNLVGGVKKALEECNVKEENVFETDVPGSYELPLSAKFLAMSGTVDAVICCGVLIKGDTFHFEYICDAVSSGIMSVNLQTNVPTVFGVLTCLDEEQVKKRSSGDTNHGYDWGKTAVEMALLRNEAMGLKGDKRGKLASMGFDKGTPVDAGEGKKGKVGFF